MRKTWHTAIYFLLTVLALLPERSVEDVPTWHWVALGVGAMLAIPGILWRERLPWLFVAAGVVVGLTGEPLVLSLALFSFALRRRDYQLVAAAALGAVVVLAGAGLVAIDGTAVPEAQSLGATLVIRSVDVALAILLPILAGAYLGTRRDYIVGLQSRAEAAEAEREARAEAAVLEERNRIAGEMHDSLGHRLVLITTQAGGLELNADRGPEFVAERAQVIGDTARTALAELRAVVGALGDHSRSPAPAAGALTDLVADARRAGAEIFYESDLPTSLPSQVGMALYRVAQEAITNAVRHAPGAPIRIVTDHSDDEVRLTVTNPLRPGGYPAGSGTGLTRMTERVGLLGGRLDARSDGTSFTLAAVLPVPAAAARVEPGEATGGKA